MENEELYRSLVVLLKLFKDRPYHLAKYLVDNSALSDEFIEKIKSSGKLKELSDQSSQNLLPVSIYFSDISKIDEYYNSFVDDINNLQYKTLDEITKELNDRLDKLVLEEKYEDAARLRDYMERNNINRKNLK